MKAILSEHNIIEGLKKGEPFAYNHIFKEFFQALCYFATAFVGDSEEAEDIVLTTYTKFYNLRENFDTLANIKAFMYITTRNACLDYLRYRKRQEEYKKEYSYLSQETSEKTIENLRLEAELIRMITQEAARLPDKYKNVFELSFFKGLKTEEIARMLNASPEYVRNVKSRAVKMLRIKLFEKGLLSLAIALLKWLNQ